MPLEQFSLFANELLKWNASINLIQENTTSEIYERHILDSLQLKIYIDYEVDIVVDIGSGAGFPGIILAIDGAKKMHLVEPTGKKAVFLNHIKNLYRLPVTVHACRWQNLKITNATIVTSRAFASLSNLLTAMKHVSRETSNAQGIFLKGEKIQEEILEAKEKWYFESELFQSSTHESGSIIKVWNVSKK
jgi:16S rRNA (guanine527-N7)-methyltransferase